MTSIDESLDRDFAQAWRPSPGDKVVGTVTTLTERSGEYGPYPIVTVRTANGDELAVHAFHEVLASELARVAPAVGDWIGVKYLGRHQERGYHMYRVRRAGGEAGFDWGRYGNTAEPIAQSAIETSTATPADAAETGAPPSTGEDDDDIPF